MNDGVAPVMLAGQALQKELALGAASGESA
jgi:hypothetical protein